MSKITRESFIESGISLDLQDLDQGDRAALTRAGLDETTLARIAGRDGVISGQAELKALFGAIDRLDHDGSYGSIATTTRDAKGDDVATGSGEAMATLQAEVAEARLAHQLGKPRPPALPVAAKSEPAPGANSDKTSTEKAKKLPKVPGQDAAGPGDPAWLKKAFAEVGVAEGVGDDTNKRILKYFDSTYQKGKHTSDSGKDNAWCAAFVTFTLSESGIKNNKAVGAREYEKWGEASEPFRGAVVVLEHKGQKHVAILVGVDKNGENVYLGGNQTDRVSLRRLPGYEIVAIRKPAGFEVTADAKKLPTMNNVGQTRATR
jgi:uncharacterized protein (TIGR02594 family)